MNAVASKPSLRTLELFTLPAGTEVKVNGLTAYLDRETIIRTSRENFELMLDSDGGHADDRR